MKKLSLISFKNYDQLSLDFSGKINCFIGPNGAGKTNLLDAIHYLSMTKSAFNTVDSQNISFSQSLFSVKGIIQKAGKPYEVLCAVQRGQKKIVKVNKNEHEKLSDHIGRFPVVLIAPDDTDLTRGPSETRRKFFDMILSQLDKQYLDKLIRYNHFLKQRNALLKQFSQGLPFEQELLAPYDQQLLVLGGFLHQKRTDFMVEFVKSFYDHYAWLSDEKENVDIQYLSDHDADDFEAIFQKAQSRDRILERTTLGVHRDEYKFLIGGSPLKKFGSQGQQKTFLVALKLAHFQLIKTHLELETDSLAGRYL